MLHETLTVTGVQHNINKSADGFLRIYGWGSENELIDFLEILDGIVCFRFQMHIIIHICNDFSLVDPVLFISPLYFGGGFNFHN